MKIFRNVAIFGVTILMLDIGTSAGQNKIPHSVYSLCVNIHTVLSGGYWSNHGVDGSFRAVVTEAGVEHANQSLFLQ